MKISVNHEALDVTLDREKTLGDVLVGLEEELTQVGAAVIAVAVDGKGVQDVAARASIPVGNVSTLDLQAITAEELTSAMRGEAAGLEQIASELVNLAVLLQGGKQRDAEILIRKTTEGIENMTTLLKFGALFPDRFTCLRDFFRDLPPLLADFCQALESGDIVGMGDLGEYEIKPRLEKLASLLRTL